MPRVRKPSDPSHPPNPAEAATAKLTRLLRERAPGSTDEANAIIAELLNGGVDDPEPTDPLDRAQDLVYDAWEAPTRKRRLALAHEALALSPDCADAYLLLADEADGVEEAGTLLRNAVAAGERAIGAELPQLVADGAMWLAIETRPYMRALQALASHEWETGDRQAAIARGWELLRLNPNDNQGIRSMQLVWLLTAGSLADIDRLLAANAEEVSAELTFGRALHLYRSRGQGADADAALRAAKRANRHVAAYLLSERALPAEPPAYMGFGDETEAAAYAFGSMVLWLETPGALDWLESKRGVSGTGPKKRR